MSSRIRNSTARPSASRSSGARTPGRNTNDELPPYRKPSHPLDVEATRALRALQDRSLADVKKHNRKAADNITSTAANVNDVLRDHADYIKRRQNKWNAGKSLDDREEQERIMEELQLKVDEATKKLEESMRAVIDSDMATQRIDETMDWMRINAPKSIEDEYQTQMTQRATQRQQQTQAESQRRETQDGDGDESMDDAPTPGPTPLDGSGARIVLTGASEMFKTRMQREKDAYTSRSYTARYARNNDYRDFKRMVHDAKYGDSGHTLGHEDTWFTETGSPAPGVTDSTQRGDFDDDDDIVVDRATISTKCPITFQQFKEPYTSTKCPHTFEKNVILEMIRKGRNVVDGQKAVSCPVCDHLLTKDDVRTDPIIVRKIKRMQQAEADAAAESSDDDDQAPRRNIQQIDGSDDEPQSSSRVQVRATQQPPQSSIIEDLGDPSESDEDM